MPKYNDNLIRFIAADTDFLLSPGAGALLPLILSEIKTLNQLEGSLLNLG